MKKPTNPYLKIFIALGATLVVVVVGGAIVFGLVRRSLKAANEIELNTKAAEAYETRLTNLRALKRNFEALTELEPNAAELAENALPVRVSYPRYLVLLKNVRDQLGLGISYQSVSLTTAPVVSEADVVSVGPSSVTVTIDFANLSFSGLTQFLTAMQNSPRVANVRAIELSKTGQTLSGNIQVEIYYQNGGK